jgi:hypothetical protein
MRIDKEGREEGKKERGKEGGGKERGRNEQMNE